MSDACLVCFFSWGRKNIVSKSFINLLENIRDQDKLAVFDQGGHNIDIFSKYLSIIDYFFTTKLNYEIGPAWMYFQYLTNWIKSQARNYPKDKEERVGRNGDLYRGWVPDYVCIIESDTIGNIGWIDRVISIFSSNERIGIASGYDALEWPEIKMNGSIKIKEINPGVNMILKTGYFLELFELLWYKSQDRMISKLNRDNGNCIGVINEITHIGGNSGRTKGFIP